MQHLIHSIGIVSSPYTQKFGIPRQPQLVPVAKICITLNTEFSLDSVRGLGVLPPEMACAKGNKLLPETRITPTPPRPAAVAMAAIVGCLVVDNIKAA